MDQTEHLVAVPSVGALVLGWLLVVPRKHELSYRSFGQMQLPALLGEIGHIADRWQSRFGPLTWFEHGPGGPNSPVGCSIDHAHLHMVPLGAFDLVREARTMFPNLRFRSTESLGDVCSLPTATDYIYIRAADTTSWLATGHDIPSQALRRVVARHQGREAEYDWKRCPQLDTLRETIHRGSD